ncbi:MAG: hypothetical protein B7Y99_03220 [Caulobacterales bacterium 32-69-10]|nr:MAG: hypothetical protein B7Y99_03220 [Caulobacterales bacterium 32-69-10]
MAALCPAPGDDIGLVRGLMATVDCNVGALTREGYGVLSQPGGVVMAVMVSLMTMYVAFIGYRMLLGRSPLHIGELTMSALKIGVVIVLASNWAAYQTVVYDTLFKGPAQLASMLMNAVQPEGSAFRGDPFDGLQVAFDELQRSASAFAGRAGAQASPFVGGVGFGAFALNSSAMLMLLSSLGVVLASKIVLAVLLALAPLVAGLLLFDATRGVVEGWLKAAVVFSIAPFLATLFLALQLTLMEPTLIALAAARGEGRTELAHAVGALVLMSVFLCVLAGAGIAAVMLAAGVRLPRKGSDAAASATRSTSTASSTSTAAPAEMQSRVAAVAAAAAAMERRDTAAPRAGRSQTTDRRITLGADRTSTPAAAVAGGTTPPLGQSYRRASAPRRSAAASRRDR